MSRIDPDAIILGGGHNGLVLQAYLARAGLSTLCLERREEAGGGLETIEWPADSGFRHNPHAFFLRGISRMPWYRELELERHGARMLAPERNVAMVAGEQGTLEWWTDFSRTVESFARFSDRDAETLGRWREAFRPVVEGILLPEAARAPEPPEERRRRLLGSPEGRLLLETSACSPVEFVRREFEHPAVQAGLLFFNGLREVDLRLRGFGHHIPALLAADRYAEMCLGGSARLGQALAAAIREAGGEIRCGAALKRILVEGGRAAGVELADGEVIRARRLVASSLNPQQTYGELLGHAPLPPGWREKAEGFSYNLIAPLFGLHVNLDEAPAYRAAEAGDALMVILGLDRVEQFEDIVAAHEAGRLPESRVMWGGCPSRWDPSQAPPGSHAAFLWEKLPYRLGGNAETWDAEKDAHGRRMLEAWAEAAPNLPGALREWFVRSPLDVERALPNMREGDLLVGAFASGQTGWGRPFAGASGYRGGLEGLYLCGSCCHPGGNVTGLPGRNAALAVAADLGLSLA